MKMRRGDGQGMAATVGNSNWLAQIPTARRPLLHKVYIFGGIAICPLGDQKLLAIGTMPTSAAVANGEGDHKAPRF